MSEWMLDQYAGQYVIRLTDLSKQVAIFADFTRANDAAFAGLVEVMNEDRKRLEEADNRSARIVAAFRDCVALRHWEEGFEDWADVAELKAAIAAGEET